MIRRIIAAAGQVGAVLVNAAVALPKVRDLRRQVAHEQAEGDRLRAELRGVAAELAESEQRCNVLAHRVLAAERDARTTLSDARAIVAAAYVERDAAQAWAGRWKRLAARLRDEAETCQNLEAAMRDERDAAEAKLATVENELRTLRRVHEESEAEHAEAIERRAEAERGLADAHTALTLAVRERDDARRAAEFFSKREQELHRDLADAREALRACGRAEA